MPTWREFATAEAGVGRFVPTWREFDPAAWLRDEVRPHRGNLAMAPTAHSAHGRALG